MTASERIIVVDGRGARSSMIANDLLDPSLRVCGRAGCNHSEQYIMLIITSRFLDIMTRRPVSLACGTIVILVVAIFVAALGLEAYPMSYSFPHVQQSPAKTLSNATPSVSSPAAAADLVSDVDATGADTTADRGGHETRLRFLLELQPRRQVSDEERAVRKIFGRAIGLPETVPEAALTTYRHDVDNDGSAEVFVYVDAPSYYFCGTTGCALYLYKHDHVKNNWAPVLFGTSQMVMVRPGTLVIVDNDADFGRNFLRFCASDAELCSCGRWIFSREHKRYDKVPADCTEE